MASHLGIANESLSSCHISSALQLIYHGIPEVRNSLIHLVEHKDDDLPSKFLRELGTLFVALSEDRKTAVDPKDLYQSLKELGIYHYQVGDAVSTLRILLHEMDEEVKKIVMDQDSKENEENDKPIGYKSKVLELKNSLDKSLRGKVMEEIEGTCNGIRRRKPCRQRDLKSPMPIPVKGHETLISSLESMILNPQTITGYKWQGSCIEERYINEEPSATATPSEGGDGSDKANSSNSDSCWTTMKKTRIDPDNLPNYLMFHLKRFEYKSEGVQKITDKLEVQTHLDLSPFLYFSSSKYSKVNNLDASYSLQGAIVHEGSSANDGHYVTYAKIGDDIMGSQVEGEEGLDDKQWSLFDDEKVDKVNDESDLLAVLNGGEVTDDRDENAGKSMRCAFVLLYVRNVKDSSPEVDNLSQKVNNIIDLIDELICDQDEWEVDDVRGPLENKPKVVEDSDLESQVTTDVSTNTAPSPNITKLVDGLISDKDEFVFDVCELPRTKPVMVANLDLESLITTDVSTKTTPSKVESTLYKKLKGDINNYLRYNNPRMSGDQNINRTNGTDEAIDKIKITIDDLLRLFESQMRKKEGEIEQYSFSDNEDLAEECNSDTDNDSKSDNDSITTGSSVDLEPGDFILLSSCSFDSEEDEEDDKYHVSSRNGEDVEEELYIDDIEKNRTGDSESEDGNSESGSDSNGSISGISCGSSSSGSSSNSGSSSGSSSSSSSDDDSFAEEPDILIQEQARLISLMLFGIIIPQKMYFFVPRISKLLLSINRHDSHSKKLAWENFVREIKQFLDDPEASRFLDNDFSDQLSDDLASMRDVESILTVAFEEIAVNCSDKDTVLRKKNGCELIFDIINSIISSLLANKPSSTIIGDYHYSREYKSLECALRIIYSGFKAIVNGEEKYLSTLLTERDSSFDPCFLNRTTRKLLFFLFGVGNANIILNGYIINEKVNNAPLITLMGKVLLVANQLHMRGSADSNRSLDENMLLLPYSEMITNLFTFLLVKPASHNTAQSVISSVDGGVVLGTFTKPHPAIKNKSVDAMTSKLSEVLIEKAFRLSVEDNFGFELGLEPIQSEDDESEISTYNPILPKKWKSVLSLLDICDRCKKKRVAACVSGILTHYPKSPNNVTDDQLIFLMRAFKRPWFVSSLTANQKKKLSAKILQILHNEKFLEKKSKKSSKMSCPFNCQYYQMFSKHIKHQLKTNNSAECKPILEKNIRTSAFAALMTHLPPSCPFHPVRACPPISDRASVLRFLHAYIFIALTEGKTFADLVQQDDDYFAGYDSDDDPNEIVGRRINVLWAKGKKYSGTIKSFDPTTGEHRVEYDDGDVRNYLLREKKFSWQIKESLYNL